LPDTEPQVRTAGSICRLVQIGGPFPAGLYTKRLRHETTASVQDAALEALGKCADAISSGFFA